ncbi:alkaline phosphatase D family protein [Pseudonocardia sp. HH130630-07]|uniref:alkaline phosphatase D family protein n=1 Tax=Pseudonocardia sp. HH130630-07 TaxID=1690815 RepID=UPI000B1F6069|nr:alkaline phosphatase D family protein [Pseudonocardia sp. HH130630-07]
MHPVTRRAALTLAGAGALTALVPGTASAARPSADRFGDPFGLGVASGDPGPDGVVLWTRLAPEPGDPDGGMPPRQVDVGWEVADDERFTRVVQNGTALADPRDAHSVHVELTGLAPGREYFYRFRAGGHISPVARTRTAPAAGAAVSALTIGVASCANFGSGYFNAYRGLAADEPELVLHLGDYFYENEGSGVRDPGGSEPKDLDGYRIRHAHQRTDPDLQAAHAVAPWVVVWDDHELVNDWAGGDGEVSASRRKAAFRAYWEHMPLRRRSIPRGTELQLYRRIGWGSLATFHMLDTRQYRTSGGSITGDRQEDWLIDGFRDSRAGWDVLGQQVFFAPRSGGGKSQSWDDHPESRERVMQGWVDAGVRNAVVLTGDEHVHHANDLPLDPDDPTGDIVGTELVTTSVTSGGDGEDDSGDGGDENPHIRFRADRRGYLLATFTPAELRADFRTVDTVKSEDSGVSTAGSFAVADREPGLQEI